MCFYPCRGYHHSCHSDSAGSVLQEAIKIHDQVCICILYVCLFTPIPAHTTAHNYVIHMNVCAHICTAVLTAIDM